MRVPEALHPVVEELIENLYETGEVLDKQTCNGFNSNQQGEVKQAIRQWAEDWLAKAGGKESQPRWEKLVKAIKEVQSIINQED